MFAINLRALMIPVVAALAFGAMSTAASAQSGDSRSAFQAPAGNGNLGGSYNPKYSADGMLHVVYHIDFNDNRAGTYQGLGNIRNTVDGVGKDNIDLVVVTNGAGVNLLRRAKTDEKLAAQIDQLRELGVKFEVCSNTISREDWQSTLYGPHGQAFDRKDIVAAGVGEVAWLESKGYALIKVAPPIIFE